MFSRQPQRDSSGLHLYPNSHPNLHTAPQAVSLGGERLSKTFFRCPQHLLPPLSVVYFGVIFFTTSGMVSGLFSQTPPPPPDVCACFSPHMDALFFYLVSGGDLQSTRCTTKQQQRYAAAEK